MTKRKNITMLIYLPLAVLWAVFTVVTVPFYLLDKATNELRVMLTDLDDWCEK
jgi:hypothetical protein